MRRRCGFSWLSILVMLGVGVLFPVVASGAAQQHVASAELDNYRQEFGLSPTAAEENLETEHLGAGIVEVLKNTEGSEYAGVWFDGQAGQFVIPLIDIEAPGAVEAALGMLGLGDSYRLVPASYSWVELERAQAEVNQELDPLFAKQLVRTSLDPRTNSVVVVQAQGANEVQSEKVEQASRDAVEVRESNAKLFKYESASCVASARSCTRPLRGGVRITNGAADCTAAFKATNKGTGARFLLTAGHCAASSPSSSWRTEDSSTGVTHEIGTLAAWTYPTHDWSAISADGSFWDTAEWPSEAALWGTGIQEQPVAYEGFSYYGETVCHSGITSETSCGTVTNLNETVFYIGNEVAPSGVVEHLTRVEGSGLCSLPGDSGGPVLAGSTALGIWSGGPAKAEACPDNFGLYSEITEVTNALNLSVAPRVAPAGYSWHYQELSGEFLGRPGISRTSETNFNVFVRGLDGNLWQTWSSPGSSFGAWQNISALTGGPIASGPSAWAEGSVGVSVVGRTVGNTVRRWVYNGSAWGYEGIGGGEITGEPATAAQHVFVRGLDGNLYQKWLTGGSWTAWQYLGGGALASSPNATAVGPRELVVVARMTNNHVGIWSWNRSSWTFQELPGEIEGDPAVAWPGERSATEARNVNVFAQGLDGNLWQIYTTGIGWSGWQQLTTTPIKSSPAAVGSGFAGAAGQVAVVARSSTNNVGFWRYGP
jgi:hypothetical protein